MKKPITLEDELKNSTRTFKVDNEWYDDWLDLVEDNDEIVVKTKETSYINLPCVFDIETTSFYNDYDEKQATMYAWVFGINGKCIRGRTWEEFTEIMFMISRYYGLGDDLRLVVYCHNLSFEFAWMKGYFDWQEVFALDNHQPVRALTTMGIEFRCSYILSGYSLANVGKNLTKYKVEKMVGDLDYKKLRHSKTPLTKKEWGYILNDGLVVMAYIQEEIERLGDITKLPLTKTGFVRMLCRDNTLKGPNRWKYIGCVQNLKLTPYTYDLMKQGFMGGFTHANHNYVGKICENVSSFDFTSSYPSVLCSEKFPMSTPERVEIHNEQEFDNYCATHCCLMTIHFRNIVAILDFEHYISASRCSVLEHFVLDNGRVVEATDLTITITNIDYDIIKKFYSWEYIDIIDFYISRKGYLPKDFILTILELYKKKTALKGVEGAEVDYQVSKGMLNSLYGMAVTDPCRDEIEYSNNDGWSMNPPSIPDLIEEYNNNKGRFLYYEWGIFCTAYARRNLFSGILEFGDDYIYADTDSLKVFNVDKHMNYINKYNKTILEKIITCLTHWDIDAKLAYPKTKNGVKKPLGVWDREPDIKRFITLGAKRYMYEDTKNEMHLTISGVSKKNGLDYLKWRYKTNDEIFENFNEDLIFPKYYYNGVELNASGKLIHTYIEYPICGELTDYKGNTARYSELSSVHLEPTSYELSLDFAFKQYLLGVREVKG